MRIDVCVCVCGVSCRDLHTSKEALSFKLAVDYGITSKSVRDIWSMRTWGWATVGYWTDADKRRYLDSRLCPACRRQGARTSHSTRAAHASTWSRPSVGGDAYTHKHTHTCIQ